MKKKQAIENIETTCSKIHGIAGLLNGGGTTDEEIVLTKVDALGVSLILRECAREIQFEVDALTAEVEP